MSRIQILCSTRALSAELGLGVKGIQIVRAIFWSFPPSYSLVIQYNIWSPDVVGRHVQLLYAPVLVGVPNQFVVVPKLKEREREKKKDKRINIRRGPGDWKVETRKGRAVQRVIDFVSLGPHHVSNATGLARWVRCASLCSRSCRSKRDMHPKEHRTDKTFSIGDIISLKDLKE